jgi:hypothetical protein
VNRIGGAAWPVALSPFIKRPRITALIIGPILVGVGHLINAYGALTPLIRFTDYLEQSLTSFDAFNVARILYFELTGCELKSADGAASR